MTRSIDEKVFDGTGILKIMGLYKRNSLLSKRLLESFRLTVGKPHWMPVPWFILNRIILFVIRRRLSRKCIKKELSGEVIETIKRSLREGFRRGHIRLLEKNGFVPMEEVGALSALTWKIEEAPSEGAILPDCVALCKSGWRHWTSLKGYTKKVTAVYMPIAKRKILIGMAGNAKISFRRINQSAASSSLNFFIASEDTPVSQEMASQIGLWFEKISSKAVNRGFKSFKRLPDDIAEGVYKNLKATLGQK